MKNNHIEKQPARLTGLIAAPFTPLYADGSVNLACIERQAQGLIENGVRGAFVCGTTGEGVSLTLEERRKVAERWADVAGNDLSVIVHVGHTCIEDAKMLATHAQSIGAHSVAALAPYFFKPASLDDLVDFNHAIASAAPDLLFYYYHMPSMTGVNYSMAAFLEQARDRISNLGGIKFTYEDLADYRRCIVTADGQYDVLFGRDEILLAGLALGAAGAVGSTYNYAAPIYQRLIQCVQAGDLAGAQAHQTMAIRVIDLMIRNGGMAAGKAIMGMIGIDCGPVRAPLHALTAKQRAQLQKELDELGFFDSVANLAFSSD